MSPMSISNQKSQFVSIYITWRLGTGPRVVLWESAYHLMLEIHIAYTGLTSAQYRSRILFILSNSNFKPTLAQYREKPVSKIRNSRYLSGTDHVCDAGSIDPHIN